MKGKMKMIQKMSICRNSMMRKLQNPLPLGLLMLESPPEKKTVDKKRKKVMRKDSAGSSDSSVFSSVSTQEKS